MPIPSVSHIAAALCLLSILFPLTALAQVDAPSIGERDPLSNDSFEMPPDPPRNVESGQSFTANFLKDDSLPEGTCPIETCRHGSISDGPVTLTIFDATAPWIVEVRDEADSVLLRASGGGEGVTETLAVDVKAGDEIRVFFSLTELAESGQLTYTLKETNLKKGKESLARAHEKKRHFLTLSEDAQAAGDWHAAFEYSRQAIDAILDYPGYRWHHPSIQFLSNLATLPVGRNDPVAFRELMWRVVDCVESVCKPSDWRLLHYRQELAYALLMSGDFEGCLEQAELAWKITEHTNRGSENDLLRARCNYAIALTKVDRAQEALSIQERLMEEFAHILKNKPIKDAQLRINLFSTFWALGDFHSAREAIETALSVLEQRVSPENPLLQMARVHHASVLYCLGEFLQAKKCAEKALAVMEEIFCRRHLGLQSCRQTLAQILSDMGDLHGARMLQEKVVRDLVADFSDASYEVQRARINLAWILLESGDMDGARELAENSLAISGSRLLENNELVRNATAILAKVFFSLGNYEEARDIWQRLSEIHRRKWGNKTRYEYCTRANIALCAYHLGETLEARSILEEIIASFEETHSSSHYDLCWGRANFAQMLAASGDLRGATKTIRRAMKHCEAFISRQMRFGAAREVEETTVAYGYTLDLFLSLCGQTHTYDRECFEAVELCRTAGRTAAQIRHAVARSGGEESAALRRAYDRATSNVARADGGDIEDAIRERDIAESAFSEALARTPGAATVRTDCSADDIEAALPEGCAGISFLRYGRRTPDMRVGSVVLEEGEPTYIAFVVKKRKPISRIDLGDAASIEEAVEEWREALSTKPSSERDGRKTRDEGTRLRKMVWDPLRGSLEDVNAIVISPGAFLATVPLDLLPLEAGIVADAYTVSYVNSLSLLAFPQRQGARKERLVAFGDVAYDKAPTKIDVSGTGGGSGEDGEADFDFDMRIVPRIESEGVAALPGTAEETRVITRLFDGITGNEAILVQGAAASKASLFDIAHIATYLHIATHGYFAPDSVRSISGDLPGQSERLFLTRRERVEGLAPSLLAGLLLAGSGLKTRNGGARGIVTAEEMQGLDLSRCRLVTLSACDSNVGLVRAGRGIMSMQRALGVAGARGSITSLWKVDDEATRLFFTHFYRKLWKDGLGPAEALRQVKLDMANGKIVPEKPGVNRGPPKPRKLEPRPDDYTHPFYWGAFVFWGRED